MRIIDLLSPEKIALGASAADKEGAIDLLVDLQSKSGCLTDRETYKQAILARESQTSTAIEMGIAVPHAKSACVKSPSLAACILKEGVDYGAMDGQPSDLFFMIAAPMDGDLHLEILSHLMVLLMDPAFVAALRGAKSPKELITAIDRFEKEKYPEEAAATAAPAPQKQEGYQVLAVTACPTGIAHTYMAAENLENTGRKLGIPVKAETNGSGGAANVLTPEEIRSAEAIIIAADKNVEMARFDGKPVLMVPVADGIHKGEELIKKAVSGTVPIYHAQSGSREEGSAQSTDGAGRTIYKHLMNGVSHMLPFVIGGGILIALAFLLDDYSIDPANFGKNTPLAAYLKTVGEQAFGMMLPVLAGFISMSIADRPGLAAGFVGGMIAKMGATFANPAGGAVNAGFLGALLAGFAGGYLMLGLKKACSHLPKSLEGIKPVLIYPVLGIFLTAVVTTLINPLMGMINDGLNGLLGGMGGSSKVLLGAVLGGMMSIDMGGPFNKAAYVFGTAQLAEGNYDIMAAVMAGGMVPPLAIALCTTFFKNKFTEKERQSGIVNYIMGLSFITEGAIPFAAQDPLRILPSCILGSAVAGGLSMLFGCTLRAPHGGLFVLPTIGNPAMYLVSVAVGAIVGCLVLAVLKKKAN